jgi:pimeloyl-ACP methyl ester carboxylesterase
MGGRVALELGLEYADRVGGVALLAPSLPWLKARPWAPYLRLVPTQLGVLQPAPRTIVERIVKQFVPSSDTEWTGLPRATHLELDCGHVPQLERPRQTHDAIAAFLAA